MKRGPRLDQPPQLALWPPLHHVQRRAVGEGSSSIRAASQLFDPRVGQITGHQTHKCGCHSPQTHAHASVDAVPCGAALSLIPC